MEIRVQYNNDLAFRKWVAFQRIYRSKNVKKRVAVEMGIAAAAALGAILLWISGTSAKNSIYFFYALVILSVVLLARFLRALVIRLRIRKSTPGREAREFVFGSEGFTFGPLNEEGEVLTTRWGDIDRVYITGRVIFLLCMSRKHWAAVDRTKLVEGDWNDLIKLLKEKLPAHKIYGGK